MNDVITRDPPSPTPTSAQRHDTTHVVWRNGRPKTRERASAADAAMLKERARIARELHDSVAQTLYAISLTASRALCLVEHDEKNDVRGMIGDVLQLAETGQSDLRMVLANIRSDSLMSGGITEGLSNLAADVRTRHGLDIRLTLAGDPEVTLATKEAVLLISREALHNVVRHSGADHVDLVFGVVAGGITLTITDNGHGFDPLVARPGHFGLQSMRERAAAIGGRFDLLSERGLGTQIRVHIPATGCVSQQGKVHDHSCTVGR